MMGLSGIPCPCSSFAQKGQKNCHRVMFLPMQGVSPYCFLFPGPFRAYCVRTPFWAVIYVLLNSYFPKD